MDPRVFDKPVHVMLKPGKILVVGSTREAAEKLLVPGWPNAASRKHRAARQACLDVLQGIKDARAARKAFAAAAEEADALVPTFDRR